MIKTNTQSYRAQSTNSTSNHYREPYKGLNPYEESDYEKFFGREKDIKEIIGKLKLRRLTILYGDSGVGKSSVLRAGVVHQLREEAKKHNHYYGFPKIGVVAFPSLEEDAYLWQDDCLEILKIKIKEEVEQYCSNHSNTPSTFLNDLRAWTKCLCNNERKGELYIILDQFEEYLQKYSNSEYSFFQSIIEVIKNEDIPVNFLISIRADLITQIDRFKNDIPKWFDKRYHLEKLSDKQAEDAIVEPLRIYCKKFHTKKSFQESESGFRKLAKAVLKDLTNPLPGQSTGSSIEAPSLQLVMQTVWKKIIQPYLYKNLPDCTQADQLVEKFKELGSDNDSISKTILKNHFTTKVDDFKTQINSRTKFNKLNSILTEGKNITRTDSEFIQNIHKYIAAIVFGELVTCVGREVPLTAEELTERYNIRQNLDIYKLPRLDKREIENILNYFSSYESRILRPLPDNQYEIFHKVLGETIAKWEREQKSNLDKFCRTKELEKNQRLCFLGVNLAHKVIQQDNLSGFKMANHAYELNRSSGLPIMPEVDRALRSILKIKTHINKNIFLSHKTQNNSSKRRQISALAFNEEWGVSGSYDGILKISYWDKKRKSFSEQNQFSFAIPKPENSEVEISALALNNKNILAIGVATFDRKQYQNLNKFDWHKENKVKYATIYMLDLNQKDLREDNLIFKPLDNKEWHHKNWIATLAFNSKGDLLASGSWDESVKLWQFKNGEKVIKGEFPCKDWIWSVAFYPQPYNNKEILVSGCRNGTIVLLEINKNDKNLILKSKELTIHVQKNWECHHIELLRYREIFSVVFSPDGSYLAVGSRDGMIYLWAINQINSQQVNASNNCLAQMFPSSDYTRLLPGHSHFVKALAFSPDYPQKERNWLLSGSQDGTVRFWKYNQPEPSSILIASPENDIEIDKQGISSLAIHPEGEATLFSRWSGEVNLATKNELKFQVQRLEEHEGVIKAVAFLNDSRTLVSTGFDAKVLLWKLDNDTEIEKPKDLNQDKKNDRELLTLAYDSKRHIIAVAGVEKVEEVEEVEVIIKRWKVDKQESYISEAPLILPDKLGKFTVQYIQSISYSNKGTWFAASTKLVGIGKQVMIFAFSLLIQSGLYRIASLLLQDYQLVNMKSDILLWNLENPQSEPQSLLCSTRKNNKIQAVKAIDFSPNAVTTIDFSPNERWLAAGGDQSILRLWDLKNFSEKPIEKDLSEESISNIAFSDTPSGLLLAVATEGENIFLWRFNENSLDPFPEKPTYKLKGGRAIALNKNYLAAGGRAGNIFLWKIDSLEYLEYPPVILKGHTHNIRALAFSQDESRLASASDDKTIRVWIVKTENVADIVKDRCNNKILNEDEWHNIFGETIDYGDPIALDRHYVF